MRALLAALMLAGALAAPAAAAAPLPPSDEAGMLSMTAAHTNALDGDWMDGPLEVAWKLERIERLAQPPLITRDRVVISEHGQQAGTGLRQDVRVLDRLTGEQLWRRDGGHAGVGAGAGLVVVATDGRGDEFTGLTAFDLDTGAQRWQADLPGSSYSEPVVADGLVFMAGNPTVAVDAADGRVRWSEYGGDAQPAVGGGRVYEAIGVCHDVWVRDQELGVPVFEWKNPFCLGGAYEPPVLSGHWVYGSEARYDIGTFAMQDGYSGPAAYRDGVRVRAIYDPPELQAFDEETGEQLWSAPGVSELPVIGGDTVASVADSGEVARRDLRTGAERWTGALLPADAGRLAAGQGMLLATGVSGVTDGPIDLFALGVPGPDTAIRNRPDDHVASGSAAFTFASSEPGTYECALDGGAFAPCPEAYALTGLADGAHALQVRAVAGGEPDRTPALARWTVDRAAAASTVTEGPAQRTSSRSATLRFTIAEHARTIECRLDAGAWKRCVPPVSYANLADGRHTFAVRMTDLAGNAESPPAERTWTVDSRAPVTSITAGPPDSTRDTDARLEFSADEAGSRFECRLDDSQWEPCSSPATYGELAHGEHSFAVRATDDLGNGPGDADARTWSVDRSTPPSATLVLPAGPVAAPGIAAAPARPPLRVRTPSRATRAALLRGLRIRLSGLRRGQKVRIVARAGGATVARRTVRARGRRLTLTLRVPRAALRGGHRLTVRAVASGRRATSVTRIAR